MTPKNCNSIITSRSFINIGNLAYSSASIRLLWMIPLIISHIRLKWIRISNYIIYIISCNHYDYLNLRLKKQQLRLAYSIIFNYWLLRFHDLHHIEEDIITTCIAHFRHSILHPNRASVSQNIYLLYNNVILISRELCAYLRNSNHT